MESSQLSTRRFRELVLFFLVVLQVTPTSSARVAVCIIGQLRCLDKTDEHLHKHILEPLDADLFAFGPNNMKAKQNMSSILVDHVKHDTALGEVQEGDHAVPLSPIPLELYPLTEWYIWRNANGCMDLISTHEKRVNQTYDAVVLARSDYEWYGAHPDVTSLKANAGCLIPSGQDFGGLNDRHIACDRVSSNVFREVWTQILNGEAYDHLREWRRKATGIEYPKRFEDRPAATASYTRIRKLMRNVQVTGVRLKGSGNEFFLRNMLALHRINVRRFCSKGALRCNGGNQKCDKTKTFHHSSEFMMSLSHVSKKSVKCLQDGVRLKPDAAFLRRSMQKLGVRVGVCDASK